MIVDFKKMQESEHAPLPLHTDSAVVDGVINFKFLGMHIADDLTWTRWQGLPTRDFTS